MKLSERYKSNKFFSNKRGWIYFITNKYFPDLVKIGYTTKRNPIERINQLESSGVPGSFDVNFFLETDNPAEMEKELHKHFHYCRETKEFFKISVDEVREIICNKFDYPITLPESVNNEYEESGIAKRKLSVYEKEEYIKKLDELETEGYAILHSENEDYLKLRKENERKIQIHKYEAKWVHAPTQQMRKIEWMVSELEEIIKYFKILFEKNGLQFKIKIKELEEKEIVFISLITTGNKYNLSPLENLNMNYRLQGKKDKIQRKIRAVLRESEFIFRDWVEKFKILLYTWSECDGNRNSLISYLGKKEANNRIISDNQQIIEEIDKYYEKLYNLKNEYIWQLYILDE